MRIWGTESPWERETERDLGDKGGEVEMAKRQLEDWQRQAMLTEYQACQNDNSSTAQNYWLLSGIFIGLSTALLGALLYGILTNFQVVTTLIEKDAHTLRTIVAVIGASIIIILTFLYFWVKRIHYLADRNFARMREIELELGMWKSWRIHIPDRWNDIRGRKIKCKRRKSKTSCLFPNITKMRKKLCEMRKRLLTKAQEGISEEYVELLNQKHKELFKICYRCKRQHWYEKPSRQLHYKVILFTLIVVWGVFIAKALYIID
jgi:hypothetical protein